MERKINDTMMLVHFYSRHTKMFDPYCAAQMVLMELCVPPNCEGHDYLLHAIVERYHNSARTFHEGIYSIVGNYYATGLSVGQMETAMRYVINKAWNQREEDIWACFFPCCNGGRVKKPSNTEFISEIARFLWLWERCCQEVSCCE